MGNAKIAFILYILSNTVFAILIFDAIYFETLRKAKNKGVRSTVLET